MSPTEELEWKTRRDRVDTKLKATSPAWEIVTYKDGLNTSLLNRHAVREYPTNNGPADYALFVSGKLLGIVEAKKVGVAAMNVLEQAKRYAKGASDGSGNWNGYRVPFLYSTNGEEIFFIDVRWDQPISRKISLFHTPTALEEMYQKNTQEYLRWFRDNPKNIEGLRPYQWEAIENIEEGIAQGRRKMLVAMATGTGKTKLTVALIYRLLESKLARRILFLVDRKALAAQAVQTFHAFNTPHGGKFNLEYEVYSQRFRREDLEGDTANFDPKVLPEDYLVNPNSTHTFVYVSTIQRMTMNLLGPQRSFAQDPNDPDFEADVEKLDIPINAFDVIIADECHRGYTSSDTNTWREVLEHFDAIKIGLTATPTQHTIQYFENLVHRYSVDQAVKEGWLVDYEAVKINSNVRINGVFLKPGEQVEEVDTRTGLRKMDILEDEREYSAGEIESKITAPDSNRKIIEEIAKYAHEHERETGRFPKTLIFAANDIAHRSHADQLVALCREVFNRGDDFVQKITGNPNVDRPLQKIKEFRNRPNPAIVVTVDMLSTGVDIPNLEFIVFLRPVRSRILWVQMLGRGTRLSQDFVKTHFTIFDCFDGSLIEYFKNTTDFVVELPPESPKTYSEIIENIYQNNDRDYHVRMLSRRFRQIEKSMGPGAREKFEVFVPNGDMARFGGELATQLQKKFKDTMNILKNKDFQDLLYQYPRARTSFLVAYDVVDEVSSETLFEAQGEYYKPADYLENFSKFIHDKTDEIEAVRILLNKPKAWRAQVLEELRTKLSRNSYPEKELQRAVKIVHHKDLADIISIVKHAAREQEPYLSPEERANRAIERVTQGQTFNEEQREWLGLIREHLIQNLTLEPSDFNDFPVFTRHGGMGKAKKIFGNQLDTLVEKINEFVAA